MTISAIPIQRTASLADEMDKAADSAAFLTRELQQALHFADAVQSQILLMWIKEATELETGVKTLRDAIAADQAA